jgi:hypothetical protein
MRRLKRLLLCNNTTRCVSQSQFDQANGRAADLNPAGLIARLLTFDVQLLVESRKQCRVQLCLTDGHERRHALGHCIEEQLRRLLDARERETDEVGPEQHESVDAIPGHRHVQRVAVRVCDGEIGQQIPRVRHEACDETARHPAHERHRQQQFAVIVTDRVTAPTIGACSTHPGMTVRKNRCVRTTKIFNSPPRHRMTNTTDIACRARACHLTSSRLRTHLRWTIDAGTVGSISDIESRTRRIALNCNETKHTQLHVHVHTKKTPHNAPLSNVIHRAESVGSASAITAGTGPACARAL